MTPRTKEEARARDLYMPNTARAVRRYSRSTRSADWRKEDRRKIRIAVGIILVAMLFLLLA